MAHLATARAQRGGVTDLLGAILRSLSNHLRQLARYRRTLARLSALSDRETADLGTRRGGIRRVAQQAAFGA